MFFKKSTFNNYFANGRVVITSNSFCFTVVSTACKWNYSLFTYFGSSNFFCFFLHNESLCRSCFVQLMCCTFTFLKCVWFENMASISKVMSVKVKNVTWRFCPFSHLESSDGVSEEVRPISTVSYSQTGSCSPSAFCALPHSLSKCWHAFWQVLPCSVVTDK